MTDSASRFACHLAAVLLVLCAAALPARAAMPVWDWQLSGPFDLSRPVSVIDLDAENHSAAQIAALNMRGVFTICYVSVGTREEWRPDRAVFPAAVVGRTLGNWPRERYLDIRRRDVLLPIMTARFEKCRSKGFRAIEPDNMDVHDNPSGFPLTGAHTVAYMRDLARIAHGMGMRIGQKNAPDLAPHLVGALDFLVLEDCFAQGWCAKAAPYLRAGKMVLAAEYTDTRVKFRAACAWGARNGVAFVLKDRDLTRWRRGC